MTPAEMARLHGASFTRGWSEDEFADLLARPSTLATSTATGFAILQVIVPEAEVVTIVVDPARRGQGEGRKLLNEALKAAAGRGVTDVFLEVDETNAAALALYEKNGFTRTGLRPGYYRHADGRHSDAVLMSCAIPAGT
ncbi:ribosomal protein S18-alanine N-acetyltransferase [Gymnodinialimonas ceratoperidinii]|uniref:[Ribosomal protein bS18]-alanine N-acetyltransferase n=1 Tax=Gymnodinialimonas ceratoperidinii TaxID=2856823 RepID=A0A8F6TZB2_9RHOB|nr:ribosomal protein S18-alanine N-acetyltransferase [Gymnodinialimonas ceratoperidinii]QXT40502.1 ribosomal protein S18-alanine N-acetyltransferase [Gymnodinialimonas ceratoperidinii]